MKTLLFIGALLSAGSAYGYDTQTTLLHDTAHFSSTYAITHGTEVVCKKMLGKEHKLACTIVGVVAANALNIGRKAQQGMPDDSQRAIIAGALGSALAATVISIDF